MPPTATSINDEQREALEKLVADSNLGSLILFGSRARGDHRPDSDWDVAAVSLRTHSVSRDEMKSRLGTILDKNSVELVPLDEDDLEPGIHQDVIGNAVADDGVHLAGDATILDRVRSAPRLPTLANPRAIAGTPWLEACIFSCQHEPHRATIDEWIANGEHDDIEKQFRLGSFYSCAFVEPLTNSVLYAYGLAGGGPWSVPIAGNRVADEWRRRQNGRLTPTQRVILNRIPALDGPRRKTYGLDDPRRKETPARWMLRTCAGIEIALGFISSLAGLAIPSSPFFGVWEDDTIERYRKPVCSALESGIARAEMDRPTNQTVQNLKGRSIVAYARLERGLHRIRWRHIERGQWEDDRVWARRWMSRP